MVADDLHIEIVLLMYTSDRTTTAIISRVLFGYVSDTWFVNGIVLSGVGAALSGLFCMMSDAMTSFAEQCIFVALLGMVQGRRTASFKCCPRAISLIDLHVHLLKAEIGQRNCLLKTGYFLFSNV